ncbi:hypothetical protein [Streptomyces spectabilis]|uniref:Uncharacterized protein n=1 Tax=Streptomyces spectabilis TaxID=68270 RepID=A0A5P2X3B4_STRST|nr:hypothetical protein [Streptomyces spectabilis]MBB5100956.1 hypothetical protein [Streptomyces spectabilis]MCI3900169.1 hypothetical protein [Streptomyces spectabilis]QEV57779.1 hypothetical protein CP982_02850 [Streptomyces spectabilis]GGV08683.1 hypothetical protein GCM10010245_16310 [Streptomyces spectabilis]
MTDRRNETPGESPHPVPRDLPDQQADGGDELSGDDGEHEDHGEPEDVPGTDEPGARRRGEEGSTTVHPEHPEPHEPTD